MRKRRLARTLNAVKAAAVIGALVTISATQAFSASASETAAKTTVILWSSPDVAGNIDPTTKVQGPDGKIDPIDLLAFISLSLEENNAVVKYPTFAKNQEFTPGGKFSVNGIAEFKLADIVTLIQALDTSKYDYFDVPSIAKAVEAGEDGPLSYLPAEKLDILNDKIESFKALVDYTGADKNAKAVELAKEIGEYIDPAANSKAIIENALAELNATNATNLIEALEKVEALDGVEGIDAIVKSASGNKYATLDELVTALYTKLCELDNCQCKPGDCKCEDGHTGDCDCHDYY